MQKMYGIKILKKKNSTTTILLSLVVDFTLK